MTGNNEGDEFWAECREDDLMVRFWGTRGSCPAPFSNRMIYGGNTSCVSVQWKEGIAVFDGGTGILAFGEWLKKICRQNTERKNIPLHLFIGHLHLDHITGIPLFPFLFCKESVLHIYGPSKNEESFRQRLIKALGPPYWPISVDQAAASIIWHNAEEGKEWNLPGNVRVRTIKSSHPDDCFLYRIENHSQSVMYGMDCELGENKDGQYTPIWEKYKEFARNCSLLIFDAPYTQEEYPAFRGFGHSFWKQGVWMAKECSAGQLCICHHNWDKCDEELAEMEKELTRFARQWGCKAEFAKEGSMIYLREKEQVK